MKACIAHAEESVAENDENYVFFKVQHYGKGVELGITRVHPTAPEQLRPLYYQHKDVFLIMFSLDDEASFHRATGFWRQEVLKANPNDPHIIYIGNKVLSPSSSLFSEPISVHISRLFPTYNSSTASHIRPCPLTIEQADLRAVEGYQGLLEESHIKSTIFNLSAFGRYVECSATTQKPGIGPVLAAIPEMFWPASVYGPNAKLGGKHKVVKTPVAAGCSTM